MTSILDQIVATKRIEVEALYRKNPIFKWNNDNRGFKKALLTQPLSLIAEVKKASPSKGILREQFNPVEIAQSFEHKGATAISVLTDEQYFQGHLTYLSEIRKAVKIPLLRKEFIIDPIQVKESRAAGADAILLIVAILTKTNCEELINTAIDCDLDVILEIHTIDEWEKVKGISNHPIIGINNRNLTSFEVDIQTSLTLKKEILSTNQNRVIIAESGYSTTSELDDLESAGLNGVLIGEGLAKSPELLNYF